MSDWEGKISLPTGVRRACMHRREGQRGVRGKSYGRPQGKNFKCCRGREVHSECVITISCFVYISSEYSFSHWDSSVSVIAHVDRGQRCTKRQPCHTQYKHPKPRSVQKTFRDAHERQRHTTQSEEQRRDWASLVSIRTHTIPRGLRVRRHRRLARRRAAAEGGACADRDALAGLPRPHSDLSGGAGLRIVPRGRVGGRTAASRRLPSAHDLNDSASLSSLLVPLEAHKGRWSLRRGRRHEGSRPKS